MEFAVLEIKGQSFMLHQIRKMVAVVVAVARNIVPEERINEAFKTMDKLEIPTAPSLGLCLCHVRIFGHFLITHFLFFSLFFNFSKCEDTYHVCFINVYYKLILDI